MVEKLRTSLEQKVMQLAKEIFPDATRLIPFIPTRAFTDYMDWFYEKTAGKELYHDAVEGVALAMLLRRVSCTLSSAAFLFGGTRPGEIDAFAEKEIERTAWDVSESLASREHKATFWELINPFIDTASRSDRRSIVYAVNRKNLSEYQQTLSDYLSTLEPRLKEIYGKYRRLRSENNEPNQN